MEIGYGVFAPKVGEALLLRSGADNAWHFDIPAGIPSASGKKHLCEDEDGSRDSPDERVPLWRGGTATRQLGQPGGSAEFGRNSGVLATRPPPSSINHLMKTCNPPTPSTLTACPDHSILLIQGEAPVILWPIVPAIVLYLLYGTLVLTPDPHTLPNLRRGTLPLRWPCLGVRPLADQDLPSVPIPFRSPSIH